VNVRTVLSVSLVSALLVGAGMVSASAAVLPPRPPDVPAELWESLMGPTPEAWTPQGVVVADSGFEVWRDSFSFFNYGLGADANVYLGYEPDADTYFGFKNSDLPALFGADVGCTAVVKGRCIANPIASMLAQAFSFAVMGGHCYGMAGVASQLFNQEIDREKFTSSFATYGVRLNEKVGREISIAWAKQYVWLTNPTRKAEYTKTGQEAIEVLKRDLKEGVSPYILTFFFEGGGHAITPTAVTDRGNGQYDIVVYDNNYPLRERAFKVDTVANTWTYQVSTVPGSGDVIAEGDATSGNLQLVPVSTLKDKVPCVPCEETSAGRTWLLPAVEKGDPTISIEGLDGKPIPGLIDMKPSDIVAMPSYSVPKGVPFRLNVTNSGSEPASTELFAYPQARGFSSKTVTQPGQVTVVEVNPEGVFKQVTSSRSLMRAIVDTAKSDTTGLFTLVPQVTRATRVGTVEAVTNRRGVIALSVRDVPVRISGSFLRADVKGSTSAAQFGAKQKIVLRPGDQFRAYIGAWVGSGDSLKVEVVRADGSREKVVVVGRG